VSTRRRLLGGLALALLPGAAWADDAVAAAMRAAIGDVEPVEGGIELRLPALAENGAQVPLTVLVDSAMTEEDHVTAIHVFATRNPTPGVASFHLFPGLARAEVQTRIRVAEAQAIVVLAQFGDGRVRRASARLSVTRGGCLS
jgi:sulfur-oxidizing protein SoxY